MVEKLVPDPFLKSQNWAYLWINSQKFDAVCFIVCQVKGYRNILKLSCRPLTFYLIFSFLKKAKRGLELVFLPHSLHSFWRKYFSCYILWIVQVSSSGCLYFVKYWAICVLQLFVNQVVTSWILKLRWFTWLKKNVFLWTDFIISW